MTRLFVTTFEAGTTGQAPTAANGGPMSSVVTTNGTILTSTAQAYDGSKSCEFAFTSAGTALHGVTPSFTVQSDYETIYHRFALYIHTIASTSSVLTLVFLSLRYAVYLFNSSGWKIGFTPIHNATNAKTGSEATSAAMTTGAWHNVLAIYKKISSTQVDLILEVDGVKTSTGTQTPGSFTVVSGSTSLRIGSAAQPSFDVNASNGDKFYMDGIGIECYAGTQLPPFDRQRSRTLRTDQLGIGIG